jgi:hypothetical protein
VIYPTTLSSALRTSPNLSSPLYRRWFPGAGQRGGGFAGFAEGVRTGFVGIGLYAGFSGLGQMCSDGSYPQSDGTCEDGSSPTYEADQYGATCQVASMIGGNCPGSAPVGTTPTPSGTVLSTTPPIALVPSPVPTTLTTTSPMVAAGGLCPDGSTPFSDGSCAETSAPAGSQGNTAALAQVAAALAKAVNPTAPAIAGGAVTCPAGYIYGAPGVSVQLSPGVATVGTGKCLPVSSASIIPGITNAQLTSYAVLGGAVLLGVLMISSLAGKKRR